jgi:hypothetical protein
VASSLAAAGSSGSCPAIPNSTADTSAAAWPLAAQCSSEAASVVVRCAASHVAEALSQFASHTARVPPAIAPPSSRSASSTPLITLSPLGTRPGPRPTSCSAASTAPARSPRPQHAASWTGPSCPARPGVRSASVQNLARTPQP